jgi:hypothetical protein
MFLPTRAGVEQAAELVKANAPRVNAAYYHGGEPVRVIRPFLEGEGERKPFFLSMTAAGQSALNVRGLDTVIIDDVRFTNVVERGRNVLTRVHLGSNEILQMAGRVHGRVEGGRVFILSDRDIDFYALRPTAPDFQLAGDSERVALTCADLGVQADELDLPVPLDRIAYRRAVAMLEKRGIIEHGRLSQYGKSVEALPVERAWAELIVQGEDELLPYLAIMSAVESLHRMTREERNLDGLLVPGSDHLTAYNLYAEAYRSHGFIGEVYGLPRHLFHEEIEQWAERRGVLVKAIEDAALAMASVYRGVGAPLPTDLALAGERVHRRFAELIAQFMPLDLVIDGETAWGEEARVSKTSVCNSWGAIAGSLRFFADRFGNARAGIEGTQLPMDLVRKYATRTAPELVYDPRRKHAPLALRSRVEYFGFELEREVEAIDDIPPELQEQARRVLAEALAKGEARHVVVKRNEPTIEEVREMWRRSGGRTPKLGFRELADWYERRLANVTTLDEFRAASLRIPIDEFVPAEERERLWELPSHVEVRGKEIPLDYDVEEQGAGDARTLVPVVKLRLPEKIARSLVDEELPVLDRPVRFTVTRGPRGAVRASSLDELQELLDRPWSPEEEAETRRQRDAERAAQRGERDTQRVAGEFRRERESRDAGGERGERGESGRGRGGPRGRRGGPGGKFSGTGRGRGGGRGRR